MKDDTKEKLETIRFLFDNNQNKYPLYYTQFLSFIENCFGSSNPKEIAYDYTHDIPALTSLLRKIYPHLQGFSIKNRIYRITRKLSTNLPDLSNSSMDSTPYNKMTSL